MQTVSTLTYISRQEMLERIHSHGWQTEIRFDDKGPLVVISGLWPGKCLMPLPVRLEDDHAAALDDIYCIIGVAMHHTNGGQGHC